VTRIQGGGRGGRGKFGYIPDMIYSFKKRFYILGKNYLLELNIKKWGF
jgi:hypothetical protein